jgi:hypothetical protein
MIHDPAHAALLGRRRGSIAIAQYPKSARRRAVPPNQSLQRSGGRWYLVCKSLAVIDKVPMISLSEPPGAELSRYTTAASHKQQCV